MKIAGELDSEEIDNKHSDTRSLYSRFLLADPANVVLTYKKIYKKYIY